ncbi:hypothetical protein SDC9_179612 [bioreactor metagenome]|uniref:Uncharacterized protein n=1 Tax=bioreactor metagenome TaxID=1076179 RepID=A0A645H0Y1_9ZZZZ
MLRFEFVAFDFLSVGLGVDRMEVEPLFTRNQRQGLVQVGAEFVGVAGASRIVAGHGDSAVERAVAFEPGNVVALPAVEADRNLVKPLERRFNVDSQVRIDLFRRVKHGSHTQSLLELCVCIHIRVI